MTGPTTGPAQLRVATANILHGRSAGRGSDRAVDLDRYAAGLAALDADVLALQEVDLRQPRSHGADLTALASAACGLPHARFLPAYVGVRGDRGHPWSRARGSEPLAAQPHLPAYGVALLSRHPVTAWREQRLPWLRPAPLARALGAVHGDEPRVALSARVATPLGEVTVVATHLSHLSPWNAVQLAALARSALGRSALGRSALGRSALGRSALGRSALGGHEGRLLLMGDLNVVPATAQRLSGLLPLVAAPTFPADAPDRQIDHLLARGLTAVSARAVQLSFSDHRALVADVRAADADADADPDPDPDPDPGDVSRWAGPRRS